MLVRFRLKARSAGLACVLAVGCLACGSDTGIETDLEPFLGSFTYSSGRATGRCALVDLPEITSDATHDITGTEAEVVRAGENDIELAVATDCRIRLRVRGDVASIDSAQACDLVAESIVAHAVFSVLRLQVRGPSTLSSSGSGDADATIMGTPLYCERFEIEGTLTRNGAP